MKQSASGLASEALFLSNYGLWLLFARYIFRRFGKEDFCGGYATHAKSFQKGLRDGVPIGLGYLSVSVTFGVMAVAAGLPVWAAVLISMTNLTSAGQFAGLSLITGERRCLKWR